jgi:hypothetical protein
MSAAKLFAATCSAWSACAIKTTVAEMFEAIARIASCIYDPDGRNACDYCIEDLPADQPSLATREPCVAGAFAKKKPTPRGVGA